LGDIKERSEEKFHHGLADVASPSLGLSFMNAGFRLSLGIEAGWLKIIPASYILPLWIRYL
jgi:hypothetical protein